MNVSVTLWTELVLDPSADSDSEIPADKANELFNEVLKGRLGRMDESRWVSYGPVEQPGHKEREWSLKWWSEHSEKARDYSKQTHKKH